MVMIQLEGLQGEEGQEESQDMVQVPSGVSYWVVHDCHNQILNNHKNGINYHQQFKINKVEQNLVICKW